MQNKDPKIPPPPSPNEKKEARVTPPWGVPASPYPAYPKPASPMMPGIPAPQRPTRATTMEYGNAPEPAPVAVQAPAASLLALVQGAKAAVETDTKGSVLSVAGQGDAESLCAVAALVHNTLAATEDSFGLGELQAWSVSTADVSVMALRKDNKLFAVSSEPTKNPESALRKVLTAFTEGR